MTAKWEREEFAYAKRCGATQYARNRWEDTVVADREAEKTRAKTPARCAPDSQPNAREARQMMWFIVNAHDRDLAWCNHAGWVERHQGDYSKFTEIERNTLRLPYEGEWQQETRR
jgi:hypothetical protein